MLKHFTEGAEVVGAHFPQSTRVGVARAHYLSVVGEGVAVLRESRKNSAPVGNGSLSPVAVVRPRLKR